MRQQLSRMESKIDKIQDDIQTIKTSVAETRGKMDGHARQLFILWTIILGAGAAALASFLKLIT
jgi:hypothetical protein